MEGILVKLARGAKELVHALVHVHPLPLHHEGSWLSAFRSGRFELRLLK